MRTPRNALCFAPLALAAFPGVPATADDAASPGSDPGSVHLDLRYRFEHVDQDGFTREARASLLRSRLSLESPGAKGFSGVLEIDNVSNIGPEDYNSTENGENEYPTVADPQGTPVNQAFLRYRSAALEARAGRQRILDGDMRFIGSKPWRNNEQTYDGVRLRGQGSSGLAFDGSYVARVSRIFGPDDGTNPAEWRGDNVFLRADYALAADHGLSAFAFRVDVEAQDGFAPGKTVNNSSDTVGLEYRVAMGDLALRASIASQSDSGASQLDYRAPYYVVEAHLPVAGLEFKAAHEVLGSDNGSGFATPLANGHRYQGWADQFLSTPGDGLQDTWLSVDSRVGPVALTARYHDFRAEASSVTFGEEVDFLARWEFSERVSASFKAAFFNAREAERFADTTKAWFILQVNL